jgi:hypothetical protein
MLFGNGNFGGGGNDESDDDFMLNGKGALTDEDEELRQAIMLSMQYVTKYSNNNYTKYHQNVSPSNTIVPNSIF